MNRTISPLLTTGQTIPAEIGQKIAYDLFLDHLEQELAHQAISEAARFEANKVTALAQRLEKMIIRSPGPELANWLAFIKQEETRKSGAENMLLRQVASWLTRATSDHGDKLLKTPVETSMKRAWDRSSAAFTSFPLDSTIQKNVAPGAWHLFLAQYFGRLTP